jgi:hypothetical protein
MSPTSLPFSCSYERPRLASAHPVLRRSPTALQITVAAATASTGEHVLVVEPAPPVVEAAIGLLDGHHTTRQVAEVAGPEWTAWLLASLERAGVLREGPATVAPRLTVCVEGDGPLAEAVRGCLAGQGCVVSRRRPDVVIVAPGTLEPDRVLLESLTTAGLPHLVVTAGADRAQVGPFVLPGHTSCLRCADLTRRETDPAWPLLAFQQALIPANPSALLVSWAAATATGQIEAFRHRLLPETASSQVAFTLPDATMAWTAFPFQAECPCSRRITPWAALTAQCAGEMAAPSSAAGGAVSSVSLNDSSPVMPGDPTASVVSTGSLVGAAR